MSIQEVDFLIVDDSRDAADSLAGVLEIMGHRTAVAYSALDALAAVETVLPTCVMLDVAMPEMDGLEFAREMRRRYGDDVVLVAVTGHSADDERVSEVFAIVDHYFTKPVDAKELSRLVGPPKS